MTIAAIASLAAAVVLIACDSANGGRSSVVEIGAPAPAYEAVTLAGDSVSLAEQAGDVVLLNVWATWCHPCRTEVPALERLHKRFSDRGLRVVGVSVDAAGENDAVRAFGREYGMTYAVWRDPAERVSAIFRAVGVPATYLIGRDGLLRWRHLGPVTDEDPALLEALEDALAGKPATPSA